MVTWRQDCLLEAHGDEVRSTLVFAMARLNDSLEDLWLTLLDAFRR